MTPKTEPNRRLTWTPPVVRRLKAPGAEDLPLLGKLMRGLAS